MYYLSADTTWHLTVAIASGGQHEINYELTPKF